MSHFILTLLTLLFTVSTITASPSTDQSHTNLKSLIITPIILSTGGNHNRVTHNDQYYNEIISSSNTHTTSIPLTKHSIHENVVKASQDYKISLSAKYSSEYLPIDQVWTCYLATHQLLSDSTENSDFTNNKNHIFTLRSSQHISLFLACCPTIYDPFDILSHHSYGVESSKISKKSLFENVYFPNTLKIDLSLPQFSHLHRTGCGHSMYIDNVSPNTPQIVTNDSKITNTSTINEYPHEITRFSYRNIPSNYLMSYNGENRHKISQITINTLSATVLTHIEFKYTQQNSHLLRQFTINPKQLTNTEYSIEMLSCSNKAISQSGEGFHRTLSYKYDLDSCIPQITQNHSQNNDTCHVLFFQYIPNGLFIDPYQISYTLLAEYNRNNANYIKKVNEKNPNLLSTSDLDWFLYDFVDVEAQINNAYGNALLLNLKSPHKQIHIDLPFNLRYVHSQFEPPNSDREFSFFSTQNTHELRYNVHFYEPYVMKYCFTQENSEKIPPYPLILKSLIKYNEFIYLNQNSSKIIENHHYTQDYSAKLLSEPLYPLLLTTPRGNLNHIIGVTIITMSVISGTFLIMVYILVSIYSSTKVQTQSTEGMDKKNKKTR